MSGPMPAFRYHPDPIATGNVVESDTGCRCCGRARGYVYLGAPYAEEELESAICPWCIADGSAAQRFDAEFIDPFELEDADLPDTVIDELVRRTPGYIAWQSPRWLYHCGDAAAFQGDARKELLPLVADEAKDAILADLPVDYTWQRLVDEYEPGGDPGIYWFKCLHCGMDLYYADIS